MVSHGVLYLIGIAFAISVFLIFESAVPSKSEVSKKLEELQGLKWENDFSSRQTALDHLFDEGRRSKLKQQLAEAGWYKMSPAKFAARSIGGCGVGLSSGIAIGFLLGEWDFKIILLIGILTFGGAYMPMSQLRQAIVRRKKEIQRGLPDLLDMLATTVSAGLAFNQALGYAHEVVAGALHDEIEAALSEIRLGRSRADALKSIADRVRVPELSTMVTAVTQAERLGSKLSGVLTELAEEARNRRMMRAEETAALMPIKMVIPMALFMLPALFVMIFGPVVAEYLAQPK
ncbi:MAG TPA: type II secretion system F family protein [Candidatus Baltobacteraceae bacterium]|jgi:tight adherence protein C|nr:type II secretion system F family protein [Candidatus Baltobacteraceae bacterium]